MSYPTLNEEKKLWKKGYKLVACIDEAGIGPLAGPVVAAAVAIKIPNYQFPIINQLSSSNYQTKSSGKFRKLRNWKLFESTFLAPRATQIFPHSVRNYWLLEIENLKVNDSKKLSARKREELFKLITKSPNFAWGIGVVSEKMIDKINIKNAAELAMEKALGKLKPKADFLIFDGNRLNSRKLKSTNYKLIIKADAKVFSCAAASILAKVTRDRLMRKFHRKYPKYGFDVHKGYPTKLHMAMLKKYGPCKIHRRSFYPVGACVNK